jgi:uncharacterized protein with HEPN domain
MADDLERTLTQILDFGSVLQSHVAQVSRDQFLASPITQDAVLWRFAIIGEACRRLQQRHPEVAATLPELRHAVGYRNFVIHVYDRIDPRLVWGTIEASLPVLLADVATELARLRGSAP